MAASGRQLQQAARFGPLPQQLGMPPPQHNGCSGAPRHACVHHTGGTRFGFRAASLGQRLLCSGRTSIEAPDATSRRVSGLPKVLTSPRDMTSVYDHVSMGISLSSVDPSLTHASSASAESLSLLYASVHVLGQAREDAKAAITLLTAVPQRRPVCSEVPHEAQLSLAYSALGDAYMAEHQHADKDCSNALRVGPPSTSLLLLCMGVLCCR